MLSIRICPNCGGRDFGQGQSRGTPNPPNNYAQQRGTNPARSTHVPIGVQPGVTGWLLFLCVSLVILTPLFGLGVLGKEWAETRPYFETVANAKEALMVEFSGYSFFLLYSVYTGLQLWQVKPNAVENAKRFFVAYLVMGVGLPIVTNRMLGIPVVDDEYVKSVVRTILSFAIWYTYLSKSKRVKATY